jgi:DNA polymerase III epsilon subunit-like protein
MKHVMLDLETMGNRPYSAIISIGAVQFYLKTGETGAEFHRHIDLKSSMDARLRVDPSTIEWWMSQSDEARAKITKANKVSLDQALKEFRVFMGKSKYIWGNSARFDCGLLSNAYELLKMDTPWQHWDERDVRTLVSFAPHIKKQVVGDGVPHDAIEDCKIQIEYCSKIWNTLKGA